MDHVLSHIGQQQIKVELGLRKVLFVVVRVCQGQKWSCAFLNVLFIQLIEKFLLFVIAELYETDGKESSDVIVTIDWKIESETCKIFLDAPK